MKDGCLNDLASISISRYFFFNEFTFSKTFGVNIMSNSACRTPICKAKRGGFKDTLPDDILAPVLKVRRLQ